MNVPERIQELRRQKGISQEELANELGVSRQAVSKWESGQSFPELDNIVALSDFFGISADYILKGAVTKEQTPLVTKPKMTLDDRLRLLAERKSEADENEEKEVLFQLAMTQKQKSILAMTLFICSAAVSVIGAFILSVSFSATNSDAWIVSLYVMLIGFALYHVGNRLSVKEAPFTIKYINKASFAYAVVFLAAIHSVCSYMDNYGSERIIFAVWYIFIAAAVYGSMLLYKRYKKVQAEAAADSVH